MQNSIASTVHAAQSAEATLVATCLRAAEQLDTVGAELPEAVAKLRRSAEAARERLASNRRDAEAVLSDLAGWMFDFTGEIQAPTTFVPTALLDNTVPVPNTDTEPCSVLPLPTASESPVMSSAAQDTTPPVKRTRKRLPKS